MRYIFNASGDCKLFLKDSAGNLGTETFSATSTGVSCCNAYHSLKQTLIYSVNKYLSDNKSTMLKIKYYHFTCVKNEMPKLELYYDLVIENGVIVNQEVLNFIPYISSESPYSGLTNQKMSNSDWTTNNDIISFIGYRTPENKSLKLPALYHETPTISMEDGSCVCAQQLYPDTGSSFATTVPFIIYDIMSASGVFSKFKQMKIVFDNSNPKLYKRKVQFF
jgi:hypothetical protein